MLQNSQSNFFLFHKGRWREEWRALATLELFHPGVAARDAGAEAPDLLSAGWSLSLMSDGRSPESHLTLISGTPAPAYGHLHLHIRSLTVFTACVCVRVSG